jgi:transmembrane sensor
MPGPARSTIPPEILDAAADWLMRCRERPTDAALAAELAAWCAADLRHARAFARAERAWGLVGDAMMAATAPTQTRVVPFRRQYRWLPAALLAAAAAAVAIVALPGFSLRWEADHLTGTATTRTVHLADGSVVTLAPDSAIRTAIEDDSRRVELLQGEAYFDVAHDSARPFRVIAAATEIEVLGTAFDVDIGADTTRVAVERGRVAVRAAASEAVLEAGDIALVGAAGLAEASQPVAQIAAWRQGLLVVDDVPVADVVARLARYYDGIILVPDADFAARRVTGVFDLTDPARALRGLADAQGGYILTISPYFTALVSGS